jgi:hypothetical protein
MSQKIKLNMCVSGPAITFQIDGTPDEVKFRQNHINSSVEQYVRWANNTLAIVDYPDDTCGTNWKVLDEGARILYEELRVLLKDYYELDFVIARDDYDDIYKRD